MKVNIPTKITIARIVLVAFLLVFLFVFQILGINGVYKDVVLGNTGIQLTYLIAMIVFVIAASTDALDGHLARKWHQVTNLGKFLDPIADKMLVNSLFIFLCVPSTYAAQMTVPVFCVILMVLRDLVVDTMRFVAASKGEVVAANIFGKLKTVFQMVAIPIVLLNGFPFNYFDAGWGYFRIAYLLVYLATAMSVVSGVIYVIQNRHVLMDKEESHGSNE